MCTQVDKRWACGHIGFFHIKWCRKQFKGCKGPSAQHETVDDNEECSDCKRRFAVPQSYSPN
ncbi:hypothetical protein L249_8653 [Ophiocordyceps polyrhachis-furcata BCC 54312]|uniref:Uncharacterized protein n=1 Tax=Ophiocordyceps polyrhachis-furcata BCC 54312 TaxID=1330021 RepID=A0A367L6D5_9HYPO|nr:hypothetical protein L249_8653 [Ophiocordyceps polyrhachis-furcata BCC 54312]